MLYGVLMTIKPMATTTCFFKKTWPCVGNEVTQAVPNFFQTGMLLKQVHPRHFNVFIVTYNYETNIFYFETLNIEIVIGG